MSKSKTFVQCVKKLATSGSVNLMPHLPVLLSGKLRFFPISECFYDDIFEDSQKKNIENLDQQKLVHLDGLTAEMAKKMRLQPLTAVLLNMEDFDDDDGFEEYGQNVDITARIRGALSEYSEGTIFKETIQNAEDAGATTVSIYFDDSDFSTNAESLFGDKMKDCQGPSIWFHNDAKFSNDDFSNIVKVDGATKKDNWEKIGSFGIGFNSVYHFTDLPTIVSGDFFVMFDPSQKHLPPKLLRNSSKPGIKVNLEKGPNKLRVYQDQFLPFKIEEFDLDLRPSSDKIPFEGTAIRLPLRKQPNGQLSKTCFSVQDFSKLRSFLSDKKFSYLLFLTSVETLKIMRNVNNGAVEVEEVEKEENIIMSNVAGCFKQSVSKYIKSGGQASVPHKASIISQKTSGGKNEQDDNIVIMKVAERGSTAFELATSKQGREHGLNPTVGVAVKLKKIKKNQYVPVRMEREEGRVFSFLPLDIESRNNFHMNAGFALSSNRQQLHKVDSLSQQDIRSAWNKALLTEEIPDAFLLLLESITDNPKIKRGSFDDVWPQISDRDDLLASIPKSIYSRLAKTEKPLFQSEKSKVWITWSNTFVADFDDIQDAKCREISKEILLTHLKSQSPSAELVKLSKWSQEGLRDHGLEEKTFDTRRFYIEAFLPKFESIDKAKREKVLINMLSSCHDKDVLEALKETRCITTMQGQLRRPPDLVDKRSEIAELFLEKEDLFPAKEFSSYTIEKTLEKAGMKRTLDAEILHQRIMFVSNEKISPEVFGLAQKLLLQTERLLKRCSGFMNKMMNWGSGKISDSIVNILKDHHQTAFVPTTHGEILRPCEVWEPSVSNFVSYSRAIIDLQTSRSYNQWSPGYEQFFKVLGLQTSISVEDVVNQLKGLAAEDEKKKISSQHLIEMNLKMLATFDTHEDDLQGTFSN